MLIPLHFFFFQSHPSLRGFLHISLSLSFSAWLKLYVSVTCSYDLSISECHKHSFTCHRDMDKHYHYPGYFLQNIRHFWGKLQLKKSCFIKLSFPWGYISLMLHRSPSCYATQGFGTLYIHIALSSYFEETMNTVVSCGAVRSVASSYAAMCMMAGSRPVLIIV